MHSAWRTQRKWAFWALVMGTLFVSTQPALAQKYARRSDSGGGLRSRPSSSEMVDDDVEGPKFEAAGSKASKRSPPSETRRSPPSETRRRPSQEARRSPSRETLGSTPTDTQHQPVQFRSPR